MNTLLERTPRTSCPDWVFLDPIVVPRLLLRDYEDVLNNYGDYADETRRSVCGRGGLYFEDGSRLHMAVIVDDSREFIAEDYHRIAKETVVRCASGMMVCTSVDRLSTALTRDPDGCVNLVPGDYFATILVHKEWETWTNPGCLTTLGGLVRRKNTVDPRRPPAIVLLLREAATRRSGDGVPGLIVKTIDNEKPSST